LRRVIFFRFAGRDVHMPRLIGSFILFAALLMFIASAAGMYNSWDNLKYWDKCLTKVTDDPSYQDCRTDLLNNTGIYMHSGEGKISAREFWEVLLPPIAWMLVWIGILFAGWMLYRTGELVLPIEENIREISEPRRPFRKRR